MSLHGYLIFQLSVSSFVRACASSNSRTFSMANDGLVGEGLQQINLSVAEGANFGSSDRNCADSLTRPDQRND
jgi:hypothetical protein